MDKGRHSSLCLYSQLGQQARRGFGALVPEESQLGG
jgi:hypothetical protein